MDELKKGDVLADRYEIQNVLGRGGMSVVYLAFDRDQDRLLALKTLLPKYMEHRVALQRFVREVEAMRRVRHKCVVKIFDASEADKVLYFTMEYVKGKSVRQMMIQRGRLGMGSTVRILALICHALHHIHKVTIHRDISPENVMVQGNGDIKLLDFGLARLVAQSSDLTMVGTGLGKEQYCPPEQLKDASKADFRADLFSVGVMFYEMLTGRLPISAEARITLRLPQLPSECDAFVGKAMARDPEDRFGSAREMRKALEAIYELTKDIELDPKKVSVLEQVDTPLLDVGTPRKSDDSDGFDRPMGLEHIETPTIAME